MLQLLAPERVTDASTDTDQHVEASRTAITPQTPTPTQNQLKTNHTGLLDVASATAVSIKQLSQVTVEHALEIGQRLWQMQADLERKEYSAFLSVLGWASAKARKFINLAKTFSEFESSRLSGIELTTLLSLCSKRYQEVVAQLQEMQDITQQLVEKLIEENRAPRKPKQNSISGWKQARSGGGRYYNLLLHDEQTGVLIEEQSKAEGVPPQIIISEAIALRARQKSPARLDESSVVESEEQQTVIDNTRSLSPENSRLEEELPSSDHAYAELEERPAIAVAAFADEVAPASNEVGKNLKTQVAAALAKEQTVDCGVETSKAINSSESAPEEDSAHPAQETASLAPSDDFSAADRLLVTPDWEQLKQLRDAEAGLRKIDNQIKELNDKLANLNSGEIVKRELSPVLKKQQNLRSAKVSEIVKTINSNSISAYYEEVENVGRVVLNPKYASKALKQAKSWSDVVLVVACDRAQLRNAVSGWSMESKQSLVQLLSEHLETEPNAFDQIDWIPEKLLAKALLNLSFTLEKIRSSDNLVDEPEIEQFCGCKFKSVANIGNVREQWFFQVGDKVLDAFGRSGFAVEKF